MVMIQTHPVPTNPIIPRRDRQPRPYIRLKIGQSLLPITLTQRLDGLRPYSANEFQILLKRAQDNLGTDIHA